MIDFIKREKIYIVILFFIVSVFILRIGYKEKVQTVEKNKPISSMTFQEAGITQQKVKGYFAAGGLKPIIFKSMIIVGFFVFMAGLVSNILFIMQKIRNNFRGGGKDAGVDSSTMVKRKVPWGINDIIRATVILIFISYLVSIVQAFFLKIFDMQISTNLRMITGTFLIDMSAVLVIFYFTIIKYKEKIALLGLKLSSFLKNVFYGIKGYIFILPSLFFILLICVWILDILGYTPPEQPVLEIFMQEKRGGIILFLTFFVSIFGPIVEEMFFRGFMYTAIRKNAGFGWAAFISAFVFSLLHANIVGFLPILALGFFLAYLYERTGSLITSMTVHIVHNSFVIGFVFFVKELVS